MEDSNSVKKMSRLAKWSVFLPLLAVCVGLVCTLFGREPSDLAREILMIPSLVGFICGVVAIVQIALSKGNLCGIGRAIVGIAFSFFVLVAVIWTFSRVRDGSGYYEMRVRANLHTLCVALEMIAEDHSGRLPADCNWCDILVSMPYIPEKYFLQIPDINTPKDKSSFALNKNVLGRKLSQIDVNTVLLFETDPGWNQCGGPELVRISKRFGGCFVLYANRETELVKERNIGKLRWEP